MIYIIPPTHLSLYRFLRTKVGDFLWKRLEKMHRKTDGWILSDFQAWLQWHCDHLFFIAAGEGNDILGAAAFRCIKGPEYAGDHYHFDRGPGSMIWIDAVAADRSDVPIRLWRAGVDLLGRPHTQVGFWQGRRGNRTRVHDSDRFCKRLNQIAQGGQENARRT